MNETMNGHPLPPNIIPVIHLDHVCLIGKGEATCAYLFADAAGIQCAKGTPIADIITARREAGTLKAKGDNCDGWTVRQS